VKRANRQNVYSATVKLDTIGGVDIETNNELVSGQSQTIRLTLGNHSGCHDKIAVEYQTERCTFGIGWDLNLPIFNQKVSTTVEGTSSLNLGSGVVACQAKVDTRTLLDYNIGTQLQHQYGTLMIKSYKKFTGANISHFFGVSPALDLGVALDTIGTQPHLVTGGVEYRMDHSTSIKAKMTSLGALSAAVEHRLENPRLKFGLCSTFDTFGKSFATNKLGLRLSFGDYPK